MKKQTFTLFLGWLLLLSANLFAKNTEGRFDLKEGDWFEVTVAENNSDNGITNYLLRYQLQKQLPNENQKYQITLEHYKVINKHGSDYYGYDSYYPTFKENKTIPEIKNQFILEVSPSGNMIDFEPFRNNNTSTLDLIPIKPSDGRNVYMTLSVGREDSLMIRRFSTILMLPNPTTSASLLTSENRMPLIINQSNIQLLLTNASFPLSSNAIIKGKLKDQINQEISIGLNGENADYNFPNKQFRTNNDGSFECPVFLKRPFHLRINVGNKSFTTFMEPGDTLNIIAIGHHSYENQSNRYSENKANKYYSQDMETSDYFRNNTAAYNTMLSNELDQYRGGLFNVKEISEFEKIEKETAQAVKQLIDSYRGKASDRCKNISN